MALVDTSEITFEWRDDFGRKKIAERIAGALEREAAISPLMLAGDWGGGKTEFIHKTINLFKDKLPSTVSAYLDAYKTDYHDDPLLALSAAVLDAIPQDKKGEVKKKLVPVLKAVGKLGLKAASSWVLKQDATDVVDDFEKDIKKSADKASEALIESVLQDQIDANQHIDSFRYVLEEATKDKQLILFIDELDRCKPTYAVQMLEVVKHVFDVGSVKFVLVVNREQLEASINHHYGSGLDAKRYLDKFINFSITLPEKLNDYGSQHTSVSKVHLRNCIINSEALVSAIYERKGETYLSDTIYDLCRIEGRSLRELETLVRYLEIYQSISAEGEQLVHSNVLLSSARAFGVYLACFHQTFAHQLLINRQSASKIYEMLKIKPVVQYEPHNVDFLDLLIMSIFIEDTEDERLELAEQQLVDLEKWKEHVQKAGRSAHYFVADVKPLKAILGAIKVMSFGAD